MLVKGDPGGACIRLGIMPSLVQCMACCIFVTKPYAEPNLNYYKLGPLKHNSEKYEKSEEQVFPNEFPNAICIMSIILSRSLVLVWIAVIKMCLLKCENKQIKIKFSVVKYIAVSYIDIILQYILQYIYIITLSHLQANSYKIDLPKTGPTYRKQVVNPRHQPITKRSFMVENKNLRANFTVAWLPLLLCHMTPGTYDQSTLPTPNTQKSRKTTTLIMTLIEHQISMESLQWRHNGCDCISNHQPHDCLLNRLFRRRSKKISKFRVTGLCAGNSPGPVNSPHKWPVTRKMFPFDDIIMMKWSQYLHIVVASSYPSLLSHHRPCWHTSMSSCLSCLIGNQNHLVSRWK